MKTTIASLLSTILRFVIRTAGRIVYRLHRRGIQHIPSSGGALVVANHMSYMDFVLMVTALPRPVHFVMNADIYHHRMLRGLLSLLRCIPVSPRGGRNDLDSFNNAVCQLIREGHLVAIFAEGTVSRTGQLLQFRKGVEHLSSMIEGPVIPVHFDNVIGSPYTYRAGKDAVIKFGLKTIRRSVFVNIGQPIYGAIGSFELRQIMKDLEVENFSFRLYHASTITQRIGNVLRSNPAGSWEHGPNVMTYRSLPPRLAILHGALRTPLMGTGMVAVLLPKSPESMLINLWLLMNGKCVLNMDPSWSNEQRLSALNQSGCNTLITTTDLAFTRFSPYSERVIYIEELEKAMEEQRDVHVVCRNLRSAGRSVRSWIQSAPPGDLPAACFFRPTGDTMSMSIVSYRNLLAVITGLRQVHYFRSGSRLFADLGMYTAFGYVLEFILPLLCDMRVEISAPGLSDHDFAAELMRQEASMVFTSPGQLRAVAALSREKNFPYLTTLFCADIEASAAEVEELNNRGIAVYVCAGMNETCSVFAVNIHDVHGRDIAGKPLHQEAAQPGSSGKPLPGMTIRICTPGNPRQELGPDESGEVWVKGPAVAWNLSSDSTMWNGWFRTGYTGQLDRFGFLRLC